MRTPMIASVIGMAVLAASSATAQRLDDRTIAMAPGSTITTWGSSGGSVSGSSAHYGAGQNGAPGVQWQTQGGMPPMAHPPVIQRVPLPPSGVSGGAAGGGVTWSGGGQTTAAPPIPTNQPRPQWGGRIDGRWSGGMRAPGGWNAYHRPSRGYVLPPYWVAPTFFITDFVGYGLSTPPYGYHWSRYYDDAVLVDDGGQVWDSVRGIDWRDADEYYEGGEYPAHSDRYEHRAPPVRYYAPPPVQYAPPPPPPPGPIIERRAGVPGYTQTYAAGGYYAGGYWYPPATTTTITIQSAPVVTTTTTTTEYVETSGYSVRRKVYRAARPKRRVVHRQVCDCGCGCR